MPNVFPFRALQYRKMMPTGSTPGNVSDVVAPPYDVLDADGKAALLAKSDANIVSIDLPHIPAKELGPPVAYEAAASKLRGWIADGTLTQRPSQKPALFVYRETFTFNGAQHQRTGMTCTIEVQPFGPRAGGGVLPHEETFSGPKEDRMALMKATRTQLSPIFGLHQDESGQATALLQRIMASRGPDAIATTDAGFGGRVLHEVWTVDDAETIAEYQSAMSGEDIFIADGHHRYTTGLNYLKQLEAQGPVPADHPARRCMFVMVSMSDPGMVIGPTHRVLGGMATYDFERFKTEGSKYFRYEPVAGGPGELEAALSSGPEGQNRLGLWDFASKRGVVAITTDADPLAQKFPGKPREWRTLDVALVQYLVVEAIGQPAFNGGQPVKWAFPHSIPEVEEIGSGKETGAGGGKSFTPQLGVIVRPTPLEAVRAVSRAGELMPQKSTFFYPKLATGLFMNPLE